MNAQNKNWICFNVTDSERAHIFCSFDTKEEAVAYVNDCKKTYQEMGLKSTMDYAHKCQTIKGHKLYDQNNNLVSVG